MGVSLYSLWLALLALPHRGLIPTVEGIICVAATATAAGSVRDISQIGRNERCLPGRPWQKQRKKVPN